MNMLAGAALPRASLVCILRVPLTVELVEFWFTHQDPGKTSEHVFVENAILHGIRK